MKTNKDKIRERICMRCGVAEKDVRKWKGGCSVWGTSYKTHRYINYMKIKRLPQEYNKKIARNFGYEIQKMRKDVGLTQLELAKEIGFKSSVGISLYESNKRQPSIDTFFAICSVCGINIDLIEN